MPDSQTVPADTVDLWCRCPAGVVTGTGYRVWVCEGCHCIYQATLVDGSHVTSPRPGFVTVHPRR